MILNWKETILGFHVRLRLLSQDTFCYGAIASPEFGRRILWVMDFRTSDEGVPEYSVYRYPEGPNLPQLAEPVCSLTAQNFKYDAAGTLGLSATHSAQMRALEAWLDELTQHYGIVEVQL
jgi:hypothetical protein